MITLPQKAEGVIIKVSLEELAMKKIRITDKFSFAGMAILIVSEDIPKGIWMGDKVKIADEIFTIKAIPIEDRRGFTLAELKKINEDNRTFVIEDTAKVRVNQVVEFYKG